MSNFRYLIPSSKRLVNGIMRSEHLLAGERAVAYRRNRAQRNAQAPHRRRC